MCIYIYIYRHIYIYIYTSPYIHILIVPEVPNRSLFLKQPSIIYQHTYITILLNMIDNLSKINTIFEQQLN